jgi:hypothetical protein
MTSPFHPQSDLIEARGVLRRMVDTVLSDLAAGALPGAAERQQVDISVPPVVCQCERARVAPMLGA